mmetsp:Transcript_106028/g.299944  ORF Transcript_106028/g.299944 Transcript_106028/m.299944 type:complete len:219 (-) Transcript_106028:75-731(-)
MGGRPCTQSSLLACSIPDSKTKQEVDSERRGPTVVTLHVYDVGEVGEMLNNVLRPMSVGMFHCGVDLLDLEWGFSDFPDPDTFTGVFCCRPRHCAGFAYRESVVMGNTRKSEGQIRKILQHLEYQWPAASYDTLKHNCCHFCDDFCRKLGMGPIPSWITNLAALGEQLEDQRAYFRKNLNPFTASLCCQLYDEDTSLEATVATVESSSVLPPLALKYA